MKFIKLTNLNGDPLFVRPEAVIAFGPANPQPPDPTRRSWIYLHADRHELYVQNDCEEISRSLGA
jgi:hypothetical protein